MVKDQNKGSEQDLPKIQMVEFNEAIDNVLGGDRVSLHGVYKYEPNIGDFVENTLIPAVYERYRLKHENINSLRKDNNKQYYPHGLDNHFPKFLLDLQSKSGTLQSCIDTTAKSARGQGLTVETEDQTLKKTFEQWLKRVGINSNFERELFLNLATCRACYTEIATGSEAEITGNIRKKTKSFRVVNFIKYRVGKENMLGETEYYWYHPNYYERRLQTKRLRGVAKFQNPKQALEDYLKITVVQKDGSTAFYEEEATKPFNLGRFVHYIKDPTLLSEHYGIPTYGTESAINAIILDAAISMIDIASVENGLSVAYFVTVPMMKPREDNVEQMQKYKAKKVRMLDYIKENLQGAENTDNVVVLFSDPRRNHEPIQVAEVPNNNTAEVLAGKASRKERTILTAFRVTNSALIGSPPESGKGLNNQSGLLAEADDYFYQSFVYDFRELAEEFFRDIVIPMFAEETGLDVEGLRVVFPRKHRFNTMPPEKVLLSVVPNRIIYNLYNLGTYDEDTRQELIRDLQDRAAGATVAAGHDNQQQATGEEDPEEEE